MKTIIATTAVLMLVSGPLLAGAHVQVPDAADDATYGTGGEGAPANAAKAGLGSEDNNSGGKNANGGANASQKGAGRNKNED